MDHEQYLAEVEKRKPWEVEWSKRVTILSTEEEEEIKAKYERVKQETLVKNGGDERMAEVWAKTKVGSRHEFMVKESEVGIFSDEEKWRMPWGELEQQECNAFLKLLYGQVFSLHHRGPCDAPAPDYRLSLLSILKCDQKFREAMAAG